MAQHVHQRDRTELTDGVIDEEGRLCAANLDLMVTMESAVSTTQSTRTLLKHSVTSSAASREFKIVPTRCCQPSTEVLSFLSLACAALAIVGVNAQNSTNPFVVPQNLTLCAPTNLTWSGGVPPYRLDIEPFSPTNGSQEPSLNQRFLDITTQWLIWTPNFTVGTDVQFNLIDSTQSTPLGGGHHKVQAGSDTSCLGDISTSTTQSTSVTGSSSGSTSTTATTPSSPAALTTHRGLSIGAIVGIAVGVALTAVVATTVAVCCVLRKRRLTKAYKDFDVDRSAASPTLSDTTTAVMYEGYPGAGICSTLASTDRLSKAVTETGSSPTHSPFASYSGPSSPTFGLDPTLRPTPYIVPRSGSPGLSGSFPDLRKTKKGARDTLATSTNVSSSDLRSATPTQMSDTGSGSVALPSPRTIRFVETDGGVRLAGGGVDDLVRGYREEGGEAVSEVGSSTLPPPYSPYV